MEPLLHFVVPFVALTLAGFKLQKALPLAFLALIPDLDAFFMVHRSLSHSALILVLASLPFFASAYKIKREALKTCFFGLTSFLSHVVLDVFSGYTPIFWPLYDKALWVETGLSVHVGGSVGLSAYIDLLKTPVTFETFESFDAPIYTSGGIVLSLALLSPFIIKALIRFTRSIRKML
ncbi:MAG: metal-dependent hydrolase [Candidatus Bathyarchaeia archaeon]